MTTDQRSIKELAELAREAGLGGFQWRDAELADLYLQHEQGDNPGDTAPAPKRTRSVNAGLDVAPLDVNVLVDVLAEMVVELRKEWRTAMGPLLLRIRQIEERPELKFAGVWRRDKSYNAGAVVSDRGSAWVAKTANQGQRPGDTRLWTLIVKKGRDAR